MLCKGADGDLPRLCTSVKEGRNALRLSIESCLKLESGCWPGYLSWALWIKSWWSIPLQSPGGRPKRVLLTLRRLYSDIAHVCNTFGPYRHHHGVRKLATMQSRQHCCITTISIPG